MYGVDIITVYYILDHLADKVAILLICGVEECLAVEFHIALGMLVDVVVFG